MIPPLLHPAPLSFNVPWYKLISGLVIATAWATIAEGVAAAERPVDFGRQIRPILSRNCFACHGPDDEHREGGLRLDLREAALSESESGVRAIVPGDLAASELVARIHSTDPDLVMPPPTSGHELTNDEQKLLQQWIQEGAEYATHWACVPPASVNPDPTTAGDGEGRVHATENAADEFVNAELRSRGWTASPEADRASLLRRLSLDLRGLPPQPAEVLEFITDPAPDAYERLVDRLLADPSYGERWARPWLDLARYADSAGYGSDPLRLNMWRYRDWVIGALNSNLPYDQFTIEQLAGDLLPEPTTDQLVATAFHRNTMTNTEGGTDDEEFRTAAIWDRTDTTFQVWTGLTFGCARCHNHKFDPISQRDYYGAYAIFNQTADRDQPDESPVVPAPNGEYLAQMSQHQQQIAEIKSALLAETPELAAEREAWMAQLAGEVQWTSVIPIRSAGSEGTQFLTQTDGSLLAQGDVPATERYTLDLPLSDTPITGLRLETVPDASLPGGGAGRHPDGNFVLSNVRLTQRQSGESSSVPSGRYVRISRTGPALFLHLAEVEVFSHSNNIALQGTATQSSTGFGGEASRGNDGNTSGEYFAQNSVTHTNEQADPWWEVDLGSEQPIERLVIWNRTDGGAGARMTNLEVQVLSADRSMLWKGFVLDAPAPHSELVPTGDRPLAIAAATADFSQSGFPDRSVLNSVAVPTTGWAVAPQIATGHALTLALSVPAVAAPKKSEPTEAPTNTSVGDDVDELRIELNHQYKDPKYLLGRFKLLVTSDPRVRLRAAVPSSLLALIDIPAQSRSPGQVAALAEYHRTIAPSLARLRESLAKLEQSPPLVPTVPVLKELPADQQRTTQIFVRGNYLTRGETVQAAIPTALSTGAAGSTTVPTRLDLARWLVSPEHPITARVATNRTWAQLFGRGLVETEEDFGAQGDAPSHPELLDWLAARYVHSGWNTKGLLRTLVTTAAYRRTAKGSADQVAADPRNQWLARGPRFRLEAEMVRDQALQIAGLLSEKFGGPSVYPYQPPNMWQAAFNGQRTWTESTGEDRFRRGVYVFWRRTVPYPSMATFDAPSREVCTSRRIRTNTPLQAFVTLNDPVFVEASQGLSRRILKEAEEKDVARAAHALLLTQCRPATEEEIAAVVALAASERAHFANHPDAALAMATSHLGPLPPGIELQDAAAWTVVANTLLNLDAVLMK